MYSDSSTRYGSVTRLLHWGMAVLIAWQAMKFFDRIDDGEHWVGQTLVPWHVSIGALLLVLVLLRLLWAVAQRGARPQPDPRTAWLVRLGHGLLYACMFGLPLTGILSSVGRGRGLTAFGLQVIPRGEKIPWLADLGVLHSPLAWALLLLVAGHVAIALLHHFVTRDDVLRRMV